MRYRPFGVSGKAVSAISLLLRENPAVPTPLAWRTLIFSAMESGVNCFELSAGSEMIASAVHSALQAVERRLLFLSWRISVVEGRPLTAEQVSQSVRAGLQHTGAAYFDLLTLDAHAYAGLTPDAHKFLDELRTSGLALQIGASGGGDVMDAVIPDPTFEVAASPFSLISGWDVRRRIKEAGAANMALIALDIFPPSLIRPPKAEVQKATLFRRKAEPLAGMGTYAFLHETPGWSASEICLAYALTEPAFATIQVEARKPEVIERMGAVADRDMPTSVAAQIEMARFGSQDDGSQPAQKRA